MSSAAVSNKELDELIKTELGSRTLGVKENRLVCIIALLWSLFQVWIASPIQYHLASLGVDWFLFDDIQEKKIHLLFAMFLVFSLFPAFNSSKSQCRIPWYDWGFATCSFIAIGYLIFYNEDLVYTLGRTDFIKTSLSILGIVALLEAARRTVGASISSIAIILIIFTHFGPYIGDLLSHKGHSLGAIASYQWISTEGVFGVALGASTSFVFLYVLFGALLEKAGAGNFFIKLSFVLLRRFTGGPAKAAVVASGLMGMISGSSMANTITVGSLTIPLMKKMGLSSAKAAAIEVSAGINGQIMPPVMGAAAFIMADYLSIPYTEVIKHAFLPAILVYVALLYIVHLESLKLGFARDVSTSKTGALYSVLRFLLITNMIAISLGAIYFVVEGIKFIGFTGIRAWLGDCYGIVTSMFLICLYVFIIWLQSKTEDDKIEDDDFCCKTDDIKVSLMIKKGMHYFIPLFILVWCLLVEHYSPSLAAYWTIGFLVFTLMTQGTLKSFFRSHGVTSLKLKFKSGFDDLLCAMINAAKNMTTIAIATAAAGIIVGSVTMTGVGLKISGLVEHISCGNIFVALVLTAVVCIVLGMGMPTTACYIIVSTVMVPVLDQLLDKNGITTPQFALHLFVLYFGLMADVTPPVGLASYAAAAIAKANPISTGIQAFLYNMRTMVLPFIFIFNPKILLYGLTGFADMFFTIITSVAGILIIAASTQGYFIIRSKLIESFVLLVLGLSLLFPQAWTNRFFVTISDVPLSSIKTVYLKANQSVRLVMTQAKQGMADLHAEKTSSVIYPRGGESSIENLLSQFGIEYETQGEAFLIRRVIHASQAYSDGIQDNMLIVNIQVYDGNKHTTTTVLIAFCILASICILQIRRKNNLQQIAN